MPNDAITLKLLLLYVAVKIIQSLVAVRNTPPYFAYILACCLISSCASNDSQSQLPARSINSVSNTDTFNAITEVIELDSIFADKNYRMELSFYKNETPATSTKHFGRVRFYKQESIAKKLLFEDSIYLHIGVFEFKNFDKDTFKEILLECCYTNRANMFFHLYDIDSYCDSVVRIKNFEKIANPNYLADHDIIDNYVLSGQDWTAFYKINGDSIISFEDYSMIWGYDENSIDTNKDLEYAKKLKAVLKQFKKRGLN
ncbi:MAG: hypothetical protein RL660_517 [Bacteroidota bacterium]|jgi:hypothetical protein